MKTNTKKMLLLTALTLFSLSCQESFLDKTPLGTQTEVNFFANAANAILAANAIYDVTSWDEGPGSDHTYDWMYGDVLSDDAVKGSTASDFTALKQMEDWTVTSDFKQPAGLWSNMYKGIYRANNVILNIDKSPIDAALRTRIKAEALFLRGYFYYNLVRSFGGVPLFTEPVKPSEYGTAKRATVAEVYALIDADFKAAIEGLPERSQYSANDLGRATKGAARAFAARTIMYQLGTDNTNKHTWQEVYDLTNAVVTSVQYSLANNYAELFEDEGENNSESIFEVQFNESPVSWNQDGDKIGVKVGTTNNIIQNNRKTWGWGFNNPTKEFVAEFEPGDPRLACTVYKDGDIVLGIKQQIALDENETGYLNRKAAILKPVEGKSSAQNIRKMRYADVLLMKAEAAANTGKEGEARDALNLIRDRARKASLPKGAKEKSLTYEANAVPTGTLPTIGAGVTGTALMTAIWHERRVELGMEALRFWDQVRTGRYLSSLTPAVRAACEARSVKTGMVNPMPLLPLPLNEVNSWNVVQNAGY